ncbi:MAG: phosphodiester glycosidase family protein [Bacteroidales bacterium]|nr:phosphodiester glycosidase family protein [Bacteroidales bacterium]
MKKLFNILLLVLFLPALTCCVGKEDIIDLPGPQQEEPVDPDPLPDDPGDQPGTPSGPWDANRGKVVTPSGTGWTSTVVSEGITYYTFDGKDDITGTNQQVFAIDYDLSNTKYELKLTYTANKAVTSDVHSAYNSVVTMNAGYEAGSIYIRSGGSDKSMLPNTTIGTTGIPNWKSSAAFSCDGHQSPKILFVGSPLRDGLVTGFKDKTVEESVVMQRKYYMSLSKTTHPYLISSAPILVYDYEPIGENFCDYTISDAAVKKLPAENPEHHQRVRHPRTAVAITENNHFIMFVVDGRNTHSAGMSCRELTKFMVKHFNPQYALNMDGGGSSTLCVEGQGDATTHVVNYPCDNDTYDHAGERKRDTHFIIVRK